MAGAIALAYYGLISKGTGTAYSRAVAFLEKNGATEK